MCNLYRLAPGPAEIANLFRVPLPDGLNTPTEIYPAYPGLVVAGGVLRSMTWGFPLALKSKRTGQPLKPKPVNNARTDKLGSAFWRSSFENRRCLIPVSAFAEAEGPKGQMTRTWLSLPGRPVFACAGIWRDSAEWGPVYSMVMTDPAEATAEVHDRMPVILAAEEEARWIDGAPGDAFELCRPWADAITIERTGESWLKRG
jgi:putative SOS response-associated peptidase YedK